MVRRARRNELIFRQKWDDLARYNTERAHGIVHTPEWAARMAELQDQYNEAMEAGTVWDEA